MAREYATLTAPDIGVLVAYFILVILVGIFAMWRSSRQTVSGYFLAGRTMWFLPIGASLFVTNVGTEHFVGLSGSGAANGISVAAFEFYSLIMLQLLGWVFLPVYIACGTYTMPEYLTKRFGGQRLQVYFAFLSLVLYIFTKCSGDLYTGALFIQQSLNWDLYLSIAILVLLTALLTITGGLTSVIYTDTLQAALMLCGGIYLMIRGVKCKELHKSLACIPISPLPCCLAFLGFEQNQEVGGMEGLLEKYPQAVPRNVSAIVVNTTCHWPDPQAFRMLRDVDDDYMPWLGFILGQTAGTIWYWCADQSLVQRALAAKSLSHAQGSTLLASVIKLLPLFMMVMPGMISRVLYPDDVACTNPEYCMQVCQSRAGCSNIAYPRLVLGLMPDGARGLMMATMVAGLMSDLNSIFNSASALFTMDIWRKFRKAATTTELMVVSRLFIVAMVGVSIAWVPVVKENNRGQVFIYIQEVTNYLAPPFGAIYVLGVFVPMINEKGAFWSLMLALLIGGIRLIISYVYQGEGYCGEVPNVPSILADFHYLYFSVFITALTVVVAVTISAFTGRPDPKQLCKTTYWSRHDSPPQSTDLPQKLPDGQKRISPTANRVAESTASVISITVSTISGENAVANENDESEKKYCFVDPDLYVEKNTKAESCKKRSTCKELFFKYMCGVHDTSPIEMTEQMKQHLQNLTDLKQSTCEKIGLGIGMVIILVITVVMFVFCSVYKFPTSPFYPNNATDLLPGDVTEQTFHISVI